MDIITPVGEDITIEEKLVLADMGMIKIIPEDNTGKRLVLSICNKVDGKCCGKHNHLKT
jgi:hypothetical protein